MSFSVKQAQPEQGHLVSEILLEAISWMDAHGISLWRRDEVMPDLLKLDVEAGLFYLAWDEEQAVGTIKYQLEDEFFWPDGGHDEIRIPLAKYCLTKKRRIYRVLHGKGNHPFPCNTR